MRTLLGVAAVALLAGCTSTGSQPAPPASPTPDRAIVLGPDGVGRLRLGMTHAEIAATGVASSSPGSRHDGWRPGCRILRYDDELGRTPGDTLHGAVSSHQGLEQMYATRRMATPDGIRIGSTILDVRAAYDRPGVTRGDLVVVRASPEAVYRIQLGRVVTSISLELRELDCTI